MTDDPFDLQRFLDAQAPVIDRVRAELAAGLKASHWMWFVFPQLRGLGHSPMAQRYGIASLAEAQAYLRHPVLGARLDDCIERVLHHPQRSAFEIFGRPDDLKFHSSLTLFDRAAPGTTQFRRALDVFFGGRGDARTLQRLDAGPNPSSDTASPDA